MNRKSLIKKFILLAMSITLLSLFTACSSQNKDQRIYTLQEVQNGTVVAVKKVVIKAEPVRPRGNLGVSVGSGGHAGLYGAVDVLTLGSLLGKESGSNGSDNNDAGGFNNSSLIIIGVVLLAAWLATGFYTVDSAQRGVVFNFGAFKETTRPGLHWHFPYPIETVELVDIDRIRTAENRSHMLTKDENIVDIGVAAQYKIKNPEDYLFNVYLPDYEPNQAIGTLYQVMRSSVREIAGRNTMDSILKENRESIAPDTKQVMQQVLDSYKSGLEIIKVNVTYAEAPQQVKDAFDDANRAREDKDKFKNQAETYAKKVVPIAKGKASRLKEAATAYKGRVIARAEGDASRFDQLRKEYEKAPNVTRKRLYLETMEHVFDNTSKIMVDSKSGNNLLYLPLDKLNSGSVSQSTSSSDFTPATAAAVNRVRQSRTTTRTGRDGVRERR